MQFKRHNLAVQNKNKQTGRKIMERKEREKK